MAVSSCDSSSLSPPRVLKRLAIVVAFLFTCKHGWVRRQRHEEEGGEVVCSSNGRTGGPIANGSVCRIAARRDKMFPAGTAPAAEVPQQLP